MNTMTEFESALSRYLDGEHSSADESLLLETIKRDATAREQLRQHLVLDDLLRQHEQRDPSAFVDALRLRLILAEDEPFVQRVQTATLQHQHRAATVHRAWPLVMLAAAAVVALAAMSWLVWQRPSPVTMTKVTVPVPSSPIPIVAEPPMPLEEPMPTADNIVVKTKEESRLFTLPSQVRLLASPGSQLSMVNTMLVRLDEGRVAADAGRAGKGFTVRTPQASIVDVGTLFGVQSRATGFTDVVVFSGAVLLTPQGSRKATKLVTGQAVRVDDEGRLLRLASVTAPERWQFWSTDASSSQCIAAIEEPDSFSGVQAFHRIVPGGMRDGASVALARPERWGAVTGKTFPKSVIGADIVQSPPMSGNAANRWPLRVKVQRPATLYVFASHALPPPSWLVSAFTRTGDQIASVILTDGTPKARLTHVFDVWQRTLDAPSVVTLGAPSRTPDGKLGPMYGIAAKAR